MEPFFTFMLYNRGLINSWGHKVVGEFVSNLVLDSKIFPHLTHDQNLTYFSKPNGKIEVGL